MNSRKKLIAAGIGLAALVAGGLSSYHTTGTTEVGVRTKKVSVFGRSGVEQEAYQPGSTYFFLPIFNQWDTYDTKLQIVEMSISPEQSDGVAQDDLAFKTKDGNDISLDVIFSYRIDPKKAPYIRQFVAASDEELREKVFRTVARSRPRDVFGELTTELFYTAEARNIAAKKASEALESMLSSYGIIDVKVDPKDYRFNQAYTDAITQKKLADAKTLELRSQNLAQVEMNKKLLKDADGTVNQMKAEVDGKYNQALLEADAYFDQQGKIAQAIIAEGKAEAEAIKKEREAMASSGGETLVRMRIAESLKGKKIIMMPIGGNEINLQTLDMNEFLKTYGVKNIASQQQDKR